MVGLALSIQTQVLLPPDVNLIQMRVGILKTKRLEAKCLLNKFAVTSFATSFLFAILLILLLLKIMRYQQFQKRKFDIISLRTRL